MGVSVSEALLSRLRQDACEFLGSADVTLDVVHRESRPFSDILRVAVLNSRGGAPATHFFVKTFRPKSDVGDEQMRRRVLHEFDVLERAQAAMKGYADVGVVRPVACYPELLTIVTEEAPGRTLLAHLQRLATWWPAQATVRSLERVMAAIGRWLAVFQAIEPDGGEVRREELREYIDARLVRLVREPRARFSGKHREDCLRHIDEMWARLDEHDRRRVLAHADLAIGNILVDGERIRVLDFAMAHHASRLHDIARLHMQLELLGAKPWFRRPVLRRLQLTLLKGFDPELTESAPLFRLMLLLHRVNNFATVSLRPGRFPAGLYDAHIRRLHRRWLEREMGQTAPAGTR